MKAANNQDEFGYYAKLLSNIDWIRVYIQSTNMAAYVKRYPGRNKIEGTRLSLENKSLPG